MSRREKIEKMLKDDPEDAFLNYALAKELQTEGDHAGALDGYDRVIVRHPKYVAAYFQKGQLLAERGEMEAARDVLRRGIEVAQEVGDSHAAGEMTAFEESLT